MATWTAAVDVRMGFSIATQQRSARAQHMRQIRRAGAKSLTARAQTAGIEALKLLPKLGDFNEDLRDLGVDDLRAVLRVQLAPDDVPPYRIPKATGIGFSNDRGVLMMEGLTGPQAPALGEARRIFCVSPDGGMEGSAVSVAPTARRRLAQEIFLPINR
jgi:hypothetical protein